MAALQAYDWPGNIRQLQAVLLRASATCDEPALTARDLPALARYAEQAGDQYPPSAQTQQQHGVALYGADGHLRSLEEIEADVIRLALGHYGGRMSEVARRLGLGRSTLYRKLSDLGIGSTDHA